MIYFFKCIEEKDFEKWVDAIRVCRKSFINRGDTEEVSLPVQETAPLPTRETNTSRRFASEFIDINDRLLTTEDEMEELKLLMRKHTRDMHGEVMDSMEELLTKFERIHSTLAACSMRMMSQNTLSRSHRRNISTSRDVLGGTLGGGLRSSQNLAIPKTNAISNTGSMKQAPSISSGELLVVVVWSTDPPPLVYFDAEEMSLEEIQSIRSEEPDEEEIYQIVNDVQKTEGSSEFYTDHDDDDDDDDPLQLVEESQLLSDGNTPSIKASSLRSAKAATFWRRKELPCDMSSEGVSVLSILRKNIGKDLSSVAMPVSLNEPLNALQRLCEELEYRHLLDKAAVCQSSLERMKWVAAFAVSGLSCEWWMGVMIRVGFSYAASRTRKPFNPMVCGIVTLVWSHVTARRNVRMGKRVWGRSLYRRKGQSQSTCYGLLCGVIAVQLLSVYSESIQVLGEEVGPFLDCRGVVSLPSSIELSAIGGVSVHLKSWSETYTWNKVISCSVLALESFTRPGEHTCFRHRKQ